MNDTFKGLAQPLTKEGFSKVVKDLGGDEPSLWALLTVETRGFGFFQDRRPKILFERHIFHKRTEGKFSAANPDVSSSSSGGYTGGAAEYDRLAKAMGLDRNAALESASWGLGQIMGFNATKLKYASAESMANEFCNSEDAQLDGSLRFISSNASLDAAFRKKNWAKVAFYYNGEAYAKNAYDVKLEHFCKLYEVKGTPSIDVRAAQARLSYLGYDPHGIDGLMGKGTRDALSAFQAAQKLKENGELDDETNEALKREAKV